MHPALKATAIGLLSRARTPFSLKALRRAHRAGYPLPALTRLLDPNFLRKHRGFRPSAHAVIDAEVAGARFRLDLNDHVQYQAFLRGTFDDVPIACAVALCDTQTIYMDIGANVGTTSIPVAARGIPTVCVEAATGVLARLATNASLNQLGPFTIFGVAASDQPGELQMHIPTTGNAAAASVHAGWNPSASGERTETVTAVPIDTLAATISRRIGLIKVDVEGHEIPVFKGMQQTVRKHQCAVVFEWRTDLLTQNHLAIEDPRPYFPNNYTLHGVSVRNGKIALEPFDYQAMYENAIALSPDSLVRLTG